MSDILPTASRFLSPTAFINQRVSVFRVADGSYVRSFGSGGTHAGGLYSPYYCFVCAFCCARTATGNREHIHSIIGSRGSGADQCANSICILYLLLNGAMLFVSELENRKGVTFLFFSEMHL